MTSGNGNEHEAASGGQSRRGFLRTVGLAGGALAGASAALGAPITLSRDPLLAKQLKRATGTLRLTKLPSLQKLSTGGGGQMKLPKLPTLGEPPLPSSRQRLLSALFSDGGLNAGQFKLKQGAGGIWNCSQPLTQVMSNDQLAAAYAEGITLTPSGCEYAEGVQYTNLGGTEPVTYYTLQAAGGPDDFGQRLQLLTAQTNEVFSAFFTAMFNTPGQWSQRLTYVLELSMEPWSADFDVFISSAPPPGKQYESAAVDFVTTNEGTVMALVELPGSATADNYAHMLHLRRGTAQPLFTQFNWLNIVVL